MRFLFIVDSGAGQLKDSDTAFLLRKHLKGSFGKAAGTLEPRHAEQANKTSQSHQSFPRATYKA